MILYSMLERRAAAFFRGVILQTHIEGLHGNMRYFVIDSLHDGSQAVLWSERGGK